MPAERFPDAAAAIASLDEENQRIVLLRLATRFNNGDQHFDHSDTPGAYSHVCLACARDGRGPFFVTAASMGLGAYDAPCSDPECEVCGTEDNARTGSDG